MADDHHAHPDPARDLPEPPHMTPDEFRRVGHRMIEWVARYMERVADMPVQPAVTPGEIAARLPQTAPHHPAGAEGWDAVFEDLDRVILPGLTHWQHPGFFAYFPCNASGPGTLGEIAAAGLNVNGMLWSTSPAATELETRVLDWCVDLFGLPRRFRSDGPGGGCIQGTASEATLIALLAARVRLRRAGLPGPFRVVTSDQAHSSVAKAAMIAGLAAGPEDHDAITLVPTTAEGAMDTVALRATLSDRAARQPAAVVATCGTTSTTAIDPADRIAGEIALLPEARRPWLHVDAAFNGAALVCPEFRWMAEGFDRADSLCINPHKWLLTNFDCDLMWVADRAPLLAALSIRPEYLRNAASDAGAVHDYRDWQIPLGRRFRALKLWFVLRHYGVEGLRAYIRRHVAWAAWLEARVRDDERFELAAPRTTSLVCFRLRAGDHATRALIDAVNATGRVFLSHTRFGVPVPRDVARLAIGAPGCAFHHVADVWALLQHHATA